MKKTYLIIAVILVLTILVACGNKKSTHDDIVNKQESKIVFQEEHTSQDSEKEENLEEKNDIDIKSQCISDYLYSFTKHVFEKGNMLNYFYPTYTLVDNTENWYMIKCIADEFNQPNDIGVSKIYEVYAAFCVTDVNITSEGIITNIKYDKNLGTSGLLYTTRRLELEGPGDEAFVNEIKKKCGWGSKSSSVQRISDEIVLEGKISGNKFILDTPVQAYIGNGMESFWQIGFDDYYQFPMLIDGQARKKFVGEKIILVGRLTNEYTGDPDVTFSNVRLGDLSRDVPYKPDLSAVSVELEGYVEEHTEKISKTLNSTHWNIILEGETELTDVNGNIANADFVRVWPVHGDFSGDNMHNYAGKHVKIKGTLEYSLGVFSMTPISVEIIGE